MQNSGAIAWRECEDVACNHFVAILRDAASRPPPQDEGVVLGALSNLKGSSVTSPRLRGEVGSRACAIRVRGTLHEFGPWRLPLTPTLSPQAGRGGERPAPLDEVVLGALSGRHGEEARKRRLEPSS
jgi:hypothetical protein